MTQVSMREAKTTLAQLVERAEAGEDIVITRRGKPVARLVPVAGQNALASIHGALRGRIWIADDFDEPLSDISW